MFVDENKLKQLDPQGVYQSIQYLPDQIDQVMADYETLNFDNSYRDCQVIAISGMGGSLYNYRVLNSLFLQDLLKPLIKVNGYHIPSYLSNDTLFIASSYSGSTEETVATVKEAIAKDMKVIAVTSGGPLARIASQAKMYCYRFDPRFNPSGQPRLGLGYMIFAPLLILEKLEYVNLNRDQITAAVAKLRQNDAILQQTAYDLVPKLIGNIILLISAEHLEGNIHIARNQLNETAKAFALYHVIPELNHHLLEGLKNPVDKKLHVIFYDSPYFFSRNRRRMEVTKEVLDKQEIAYSSVVTTAENKIEEFLMMLQINSYLSFFLSMEYILDPSKIPWVDYFKSKLSSTT